MVINNYISTGRSTYHFKLKEITEYKIYSFSFKEDNYVHPFQREEEGKKLTTKESTYLYNSKKSLFL